VKAGHAGHVEIEVPAPARVFQLRVLRDRLPCLAEANGLAHPGGPFCLHQMQDDSASVERAV